MRDLIDRFESIVSAVRRFYKTANAAVYIQSIAILTFHSYLIWLLSTNHATPSTPPRNEDLVGQVALYADDQFWIVIHSLVIVIAGFGFITKKANVLETAFALSAHAFLLWALMLFSWYAKTPDLPYTGGGAVLVLSVFSFTTSWAWNTRED